MIGLRTRQEIKDNIPLMVWPIQKAEIADDRKIGIGPTLRTTVGYPAYLREIVINAWLPWWAWLCLGLIPKKCKRDIETMCTYHGHRDAQYIVVIR